MFASLKSKIKEETGSDIGKLTTTWRTGAFLGRITNKDDTTTSPSSSGGRGDSNSESISPQMENYLKDRTGGHLDHTKLEQEYSTQLEEKLRERDAIWEKKIEELKDKFNSLQGEEAVAAQGVARAAAAEAARAEGARAAAERQLADVRARLAASHHAHERLDHLTEELENARREWGRERIEFKVSLGESESKIRYLTDELTLVKASLPPGHKHHLFEGEDNKSASSLSTPEEYDRVRREHSVLTRQLQEARMALADVKTSWSGQIAALETQVARLSRQAGEEGAERRRVESEREELREELLTATAEINKLKQNLANSDAKVTRLNGEVRTLASELKNLRSAASRAGVSATQDDLLA